MKYCYDIKFSVGIITLWSKSAIKLSTHLEFTLYASPVNTHLRINDINI